MSIMVEHSFRDLMSIENEINRLFGRTYGGGEAGTGTGTTGTWVPPLDVFESQDTFVVAVELPGIEPGDKPRKMTVKAS
jgi:HSP20 family molecular chaperone IbpA